jgi:2-polyprenyl-3-methyl-5-hydroxy-6-metoxy-1,4-benzoquinol methylase
MTTALSRVRQTGWRLVARPRAWIDWFRAASARIRDHHSDRAFGHVAPFIADGARVLDLGAYDGRLGLRLRDRKGCEVVLADVVDANVTDLPLRRISGATVPLAAGERFDVVTIMDVLHHAADDLGLLREARRAVADGGRVLIAGDQVEHLGQRALTVGFHLWLLAFAWMGWKGRFRTSVAWTIRFALAGLAVEAVVPLGAAGRLWPRNILYVLRPR